MANEQVMTEKIDVGPADVTFATNYIGKTNGASTFMYGLEYFAIETEEDGTVDEVVSDENTTFEVPLAYTDPETLADMIPWANLVDDGASNYKLVIGGAIGEKMSTYADELTIHPRALDDTDASKDITIHNCYPKPQEISLEYAREGIRTATIMFRAIKDTSGEYFTIGDPEITQV